MTTKINAAIISTSHTDTGDNKQPTGLWLSELVEPYYMLKDKGINVEVFSIQGGRIPFDPRSVSRKGENDDYVERYLNDESAQSELSTSAKISSLKVNDFDIIFLPGGHGTMWDFADNKTLGKIVTQTLNLDKILAAVCHGPAGLLSANDAKGNSILKGRKVTGFSNSEEKSTGLNDIVPFHLETKLRESGADYQKDDDFKPFALRDGNLITGQNPASAKLVADYILEAINEREDFKHSRLAS